MVSDPMIVPAAVGLNAALILQLCSGARAFPAHVLLVVKPAPTTVIDEMFRVAAPVFVNKTDCDGLCVPTSRDPNPWKVPLKVAVGVSRTSRMRLLLVSAMYKSF